MPEEHYLAPIIRAFLTTHAGMQLLEEPAECPTDSQCKTPRHFLKSPKIRHHAGWPESDESCTNRAAPIEGKPAQTIKQSKVERPPTALSTNPTPPNQNNPKHKRPHSTNHSAPCPRRHCQPHPPVHNTFTIFTPLLPQPRRKSAASRPTQLNKSQVLKNDACPASLAATKSPTVPARNTDCTSSTRGHGPRKSSSFQANQTAYDTSSVHESGNFAGL